MAIAGSAQKETYDIISYSVPKSWKKEILENALQLSAVDNKTGEYIAVVVVKSTASNLSANENFTDHWTKLVKSTVAVAEDPAMQAPAKDKDWDIVSGQANYTDGSAKGIVTQITATGYGKVISLVAMTNTDKFRNDLEQFFNSLELTELTTTPTTSEPTPSADGNTTIVGLWTYYIVETNGGYYANGIYVTNYTAGYFRKEYTFYADGTYRFLEKDWSVNMKDIFFAYETGTWKVAGNKLTIKPSNGKNESWSKSASNRTNEWGSLVKATERKLETITYTYDLHYYEGSKETSLLLYYNKDTERDGTLSSKNDKGYYWSFSPRTGDKVSLIDMPPGKKIGNSNPKPSSATKNKSQAATVTPSGKTISSPVAGKIWEATSAEKFISGSMSGYTTGGYFTYQYTFNTNGTYRFIYIGASAYIQPNLLHYETGTYSVSGNKLTIVPASGFNEEWSVVGGPINLAGMSDVSIGNIKHNWGKRIKTEKRTLEKVTYTISTEYWAGNKANALKLEWDGGKTVREGSGNFTYYLETTEVQSAKLPAGIK